MSSPVYFVCALPFILSGTIVSLAISETIERVDRVYFFDLLGAAGGCLVLVPLLNWLRRTEHASSSPAVFSPSPPRSGSMSARAAPRRVQPALRLALAAGRLITYNCAWPVIDIQLRQRPDTAERALRAMEQLFAHRPDKPSPGQRA